MRTRKFTSTAFLIAMWIVSAVAVAAGGPRLSSVDAVNDVVVTSFTEGQEIYIRYNTGTTDNPQYQYINSGATYGRNCVMSTHGAPMYITMTNNDGTTAPELGGGQTYFVKAPLYTSDTKRFLGNSLGDAIFETKGFPIRFEAVDAVNKPNSYYIYFYNLNAKGVATGQGYLQYNSNLDVTLKANSGTKVEWEVVTKEQMIAELGAASSYNAVDATFFISDPGFSRNFIDTLKKQWKFVCGGTSQDLVQNQNVTSGTSTAQSNCGSNQEEGKKSALKTYVKKDGDAYSVQQVLTGIPNGKYRLYAQGVTSEEGGCYLFADNGDPAGIKKVAFGKNANVKSTINAYDAFNGSEGSNYLRYIDVDVEDNTLTVGVTGLADVTATSYVDNFELYYYGELDRSSVYNTEVSDYTPATMTSPWIEVGNSTNEVLEHPEKYFFALWSDVDGCFILGDGTDGLQGSDYKTMVYKKDINPADDLSYMWEIYKNGSRYIFVSPADRENMMQSEASTYYRYNDATEANVGMAGLSISTAGYNNIMLYTLYGQCLHKWKSTKADIVSDTYPGFLKLYAIPRTYLVCDKPNVLSTASFANKIDLTSLVLNPDAFGQSGYLESGVFGWEMSENKSVWVKNGTSSDFGALNGRSYFEFDKDVDGTFSQTLTDLPSGNYKLSVSVSGAAKGASLFLSDGTNETTALLKNADSDNVVTIEAVVTSGTITFGVKTSSYAGSENLKFDNFKLEYAGPISGTPLSDGSDIYIRYNAGSDDKPEYYYLNAGSYWGTRAITSVHPLAYTISETANENGYTIQSAFANGGGTNLTQSYLQNKGSYYGNDGNSTEFKLIPVDENDLSAGYYIYCVSTKTYLTPNGGGNPIVDSTTPFAWQIFNKSEMVNQLSSASETNPKDATFLIKDPDISRNNRLASNWKFICDGTEKSLAVKSTVTTSNTSATYSGNDGNTLYANYNIKVLYPSNGKSYVVQQTLTDLPNGYYTLYAQGISSSSSATFLFASDGTNELASVAFDVPETAFTSGTSNQMIEQQFFRNTGTLYVKSLTFKVTDGTAVIGVKGDIRDVTTYFDNFELYYCGASVSNTYYYDEPKDYTPADISDKWVEVTSSSTDILNNPQDYLFSIWHNASTPLMLGAGSADYQGTAFSTMTLGSSIDPIENGAYLWEFLRTDNGGYTISNLTEREFMLQTEDGQIFYRFNDNTRLNVANSEVTFESADYNNWALHTPQGYVHHAEANVNDVVVDAEVGYLKIYAIPRSYYAMVYSGVVYSATSVSPADVSLMVVNPEAVGTSGDLSSTVLGWTHDSSRAWTIEGTSSDFTTSSGNSYFCMDRSSMTTFSQVINDLLPGDYKLTVYVNSLQEGATLYATDGALTESVDLSEAESGLVSLPFTVSKGKTSVTIGINTLSYSDYPNVLFDKFQLYYLGAPSDMSVDLKEDVEYYIRYNNSTTAVPDYVYINSGSTWGTRAVTKEHGMPLVLAALGETSTLEDFYGLQPYSIRGELSYASNSANAGYLSYGTGSETKRFYMDQLAKKFIFKPVDAVNKPNVYYIFAVDSSKYLVPATGDGIQNDASYVLGMSTEPAEWEVLSKAQLINGLADASVYMPVDATFLMSNYDLSNKYVPSYDKWVVNGNGSVSSLGFSTNNTVGDVVVRREGANWAFSIKAMVGNTGNDFTVQQTITGLPSGKYRLSAYGAAMYENSAYLFASDGTNVLASDAFVSDSYITSSVSTYNVINGLFYGKSSDSYKTVIEFEVTDGTLVFGLSAGQVAKDTIFVDRFELYYCGDKDASGVYNSVPVSFIPDVLSNSWVEVKSLMDDAMQNPQNYLFTIWENPTDCAGIAEGTDGFQGSDYKTMATTFDVNPLNDLSTIWEFYKGDDGKYLIVNASERENVLLTEDNDYFFRYNDQSSIVYDKGFVTFTEAKYNNWTLKSAKGYLHRWDSSCNDYVVDKNKGYSKIYAISRVQYYIDVKDILYTSSILTPIDVPLLISNNEGIGEDGKEPLMWNFSVSDEIKVQDNSESSFSLVSGNQFFEYSSESSPTTVMSQTISNLPRGYYLFEVTTNTTGNSGYIFAEATGQERLVEDLSSSDPETHIVAVPVQLDVDGGSITFGIDISEYQHTADAQSSTDESNYLIQFDKFNLKYMGVSEVLVSEINEGDYFIRTNVNYGTSLTPEYRYLNSGGYSWGTDPVLDSHGYQFGFDLREDNTLNDGYTYYSIASELYQSGNDHGSYFDGLHHDHHYNNSWFRLMQVDPENNPLQYKLYTRKPLSGNPGYMNPASDGSLYISSDYDNACVWELITATQRIKELQDATADNPMDATFFIKDPSFSRNNVNKVYWHLNSDDNTLPITLGNNESGTNVMNTSDGKLRIRIGNENYHGLRENLYDFNVKMEGLVDSSTPYDLYQKVYLENLPAGRYRLSIHGYSNIDGGAVLYASDGTDELGSVTLDHSVSGKTEASTQAMAAYLFNYGKEGLENHVLTYGFKDYASEVSEASTTLAKYLGYKTTGYYKSVEIEITSDNLVVGVRGELGKNDYAIFDNIELYYLGESLQSISEMTSPTDVYVYNVDAGKYLGTTKETDSKKNMYSFVEQDGIKFTLEPVDASSGAFYISTTEIDGNKYYLCPGSGLVGMTFVNATTPYVWTVESYDTSDDNKIYKIKDQKGRLFGWSGDEYGLVFTTISNDLEPRGDQWVFHRPGQYQKNRLFSKLASNVRRDYWPVIRAARVNMKNFTGSREITGLKDAYNNLFDVWSGSLASTSSLTSLAENLKNVMLTALPTYGTLHNPVDGSFLIKEAGLGTDDSWTKKGTWSKVTVNSTASSVSSANGIVNVGRFLYSSTAGRTLSQTLTGLPAGRYKLAVDIRSRSAGGWYTLSMSSTDEDNNDISSVLDNGYVEKFTTISTKTTPYLEVQDGRDVTISLKLVSGSIAFDNFKLLYCGDLRGNYELNSDATELTLLGNWDNMPGLEEEVLGVIEDNISTLGAVYVYKDEVTLSSELNVTDAGWQTGGNNILFYTDYESDLVSGSSNIVTKSVVDNGDEEYVVQYDCTNLVLTDKMTLFVPYQFNAETATYSRTSTLIDGKAWGTLVMPFNLTTLPENVTSYYLPSMVDDNYTYGKLKVTSITDNTLAANTPVIYVATGDLSINEENVVVKKTSELKSPDPVNDDITLYGSYVKYYVGVLGCESSDVENSDGLSAENCYYVKSNKFYRGNCYFSIAPFRAFVYRGKVNEDDESSNIGARASVLEIEIDDIANGIAGNSVDDVSVVGYYDAHGLRHSELVKGVNIIRYSDGSSRKIYLK